MAKVTRKLDVGITVVIATVASSIGAVLVPATPVDTGFARANWRPSLNVPAEVPITFLDPTGSATIAKIAIVAARYRPGDVFFLVNNAKYIHALNQGTSPQAPPGFVQKSAQRGTERALAAFEAGILKAIPAGSLTGSRGARDFNAGKFVKVA